MLHSGIDLHKRARHGRVRPISHLLLSARPAPVWRVAWPLAPDSSHSGSPTSSPARP